MPAFSIIIPVYNRPDEVDELLESLRNQADSDMEVIIVEDGSEKTCKEIVEKYAGSISVSYYFIANSGPGAARNVGAGKSAGDYLLILDSDCILPPDYIAAVRKGIETTGAEAFGGPDRALDSFTPVQKAINYAMTSFFTTGGIRGGKKKMDKFYPRSFNMGIKKEVFEKLGGFSKMRFGEDIDFSIRLYRSGYKVALFPEAFVYHKRRTDFKKFFKQVYNSGIARIHLYKKYPDSLKLVHCFPSAFTLFLALSVIALPWCRYGFLLCLLYAILIFIDAAFRNKSIKIGLLSAVASFVQLTGYGTGFLSGVWNRIICRKGEFAAFEKNFYK
jgi:GT2 family glycosyltransferase